MNVKENLKENVHEPNDCMVENEEENIHEEQLSEMRNGGMDGRSTWETSGSVVLNDTGNNVGKNDKDIGEEDGSNPWRENDNKNEIKNEENIWDETRNDGMDEADQVKSNNSSNQSVPDHRR